MSSSMSKAIELPWGLARTVFDLVRTTPLSILALTAVLLLVAAGSIIFLAVVVLAPDPRPAVPAEKQYITSTPSGKASSPKPLPAWHDAWERKQYKAGVANTSYEKESHGIEAAEIFMSVIVPAYNEDERIEGMLEEAIAYLDTEYGRQPDQKYALKQMENGTATSKAPDVASTAKHRGEKPGRSGRGGYEIIVVNDGSKDRTVDVVLKIAQKHELHDVLRIVTLKENRGKGGAVTHGFRHVRGEYAIFADADGASTFSDLGKLVEGCQTVQDESGRGIAVGSRAHMVGSDAVIQRSALRNFLMHGFHLFLRLMTPPATSHIADTQCGFKLFSRASLPHIIPYMHAEGWIFDVEMLMLAESAPRAAGRKIGAGPGIKVAEVAIGWREIGGSKLNVIQDSIGMAWGLMLLRLSWAFGVYKRR